MIATEKKPTCLNKGQLLISSGSPLGVVLMCREENKNFLFQDPVMFAPSPPLPPTPQLPQRHGRYSTADHFPGNQERGGAVPAKKLLQESGKHTKGAILSPCIPLPFRSRYKEKGFAESRLWANPG